MAAVTTGFEPVTLRLTTGHSDQTELSHLDLALLRLDSNQRNLPLNRRPLYQLSYAGMVAEAGFEPAISGL